jgi:hypothetical protein
MIDCLLVFCKVMLLYGKFAEKLLLKAIYELLRIVFVVVLEK